MLYNDGPIVRPKQDLLNRAGFSFSLAKAIHQLTIAEQGFVIALLGEWGSGKSSILELVARYLKHLDCQRFAPPDTSIDQLESMLEIYERIEGKVDALRFSDGNVSYWEKVNRQKIFATWLASDADAEIASRYFCIEQAAREHGSNIVIRFSPWLISGRAELAQALLSELARALESYLGPDVSQAFANVLKRLSEFAPVVGGGLDLVTAFPVSKIFLAGGEWTGKLARGMTSGPTLEQERNRLRDALRDMGKKIVVIMDDLDRLIPTEALEIISTVKSLGDLPNVIYVLSYAEDRLTQSLDSVVGGERRGHEFLEKIVQYPVHVPALDSTDISALLDADLLRIFGTFSPREQRMLSSSWYYVLQHYLKTPRNVRRFSNALSFHISSMGDYLDKIDLFNLTVLQMHEPEMYSWVRQNLHEVT